MAWDIDHNPETRPIGCNGKYGGSGMQYHRAHGTTICQDCRDSHNHYQRERRRGGLPRRRPAPCGTNAAVDRHRRRKEPLDFACKLAEAKHQAEYRERIAREAVGNVHAEGKLLADWIVTRRRRRCGDAGKHAIGHCENCGVHRAPRRANA